MGNKRITTHATQYTNQLGQTKWQPKLTNGKTLWHNYHTQNWQHRSTHTHPHPKLYKTKHRAQNKAKRHEKRIKKRTYKPT